MSNGKELQKNIGFFSAFAIVMGTVIGSGDPAQMVMMPPRNHTNKAIPAVPVTSVTFDILKNTPVW
jgi:hypothetical protein